MGPATSYACGKRRWYASMVAFTASVPLCVTAYYLGTIAAESVSQAPSPAPLPTVLGLHMDAASLDMGEVWETPQHVLHLNLKNVGSETRVVRDFSGSCSCTTIEPRAFVLKPGDTIPVAATIDLTSRTPQQIGLSRRQVAVRLDPVFDGNFSPTPGWTVFGTVRSYVTLDHAKLVFADGCVHRGEPRSRKVRVKAHVPLVRLEAVAPIAGADVRIEPAGQDEQSVVITPNPTLPPGPFQFAVTVRVVTPDGVAHLAAIIEVSGEMQSPVRVFPRTVLLGEIPVPGNADAEVTLQLPTTAGWSVACIETGVSGTAVTRLSKRDGEIRYRIRQRVTTVGDYQTEVRFIVRDPAGKTEPVTVDLRYSGQSRRDGRVAP